MCWSRTKTLMEQQFKLPPLNNKVVIGLTGAMASGKSTVLNFFKELGAFTLSADALVAHECMPGARCHDQLKAAFGDLFFNSDGTINKRAFASLIFNDNAKRLLAEDIIHPYVYEKAIDIISRAKEDIIVFEIPLLFETNVQDEFDLVVCVFAGGETRKTRALERGLTEEEFKKRDSFQLSIEKKVSLADCVIENASDLNILKEQVKEIYNFAKQIRSK